jgi:hypothetical protein
MGKGLLFFCCACCILLLTIINLSIGPIVSYTVGSSWGTLNCAEEKDNYDDAKDFAKKANTEIPDDVKKYYYKYRIDRCERRKGMHDMEYTAFIFDIVIGFVCGLIGLLHLFELKKEFISNTGLIGLGCGVVGFVLTFVYVIFNGLVYTNYDTGVYKIDGDGAFAELEGNRYKCLYYDDKALNKHSFYAKYSDLGKKQYNYNKGLEEDLEENGCRESPGICLGTDLSGFSIGKEYYEPLTIPKKDGNDCKILYTNEDLTTIGIGNKDMSDRFLTALILSIFVCLANIGLALFGFLLFRAPSDF